jgi:hypothetical protein
VTRLMVHRAAVFTAGAVLALGLHATAAGAASAQHNAPAKTTNCQPANELTAAQRDALPSFRVCSRFIVPAGHSR